MRNFLPYLDWIAKQKMRMQSLVEQWSNVNSSTNNLEGLAVMASLLQSSFGSIGKRSQLLDAPPYYCVNAQGEAVKKEAGTLLSMSQRPGAPLRLFLGGHMDTVYAKESPFQVVSYQSEKICQGPGVADMKGGLAVLLIALEALESCEACSSIGWELFINADEEIGSPSSGSLIKEVALKTHLGLIFEPCLPNGALVVSRMGSANYTITAKGRSAHVGREYALGRNAIQALAEWIALINAIFEGQDDLIINVGSISGGGPTNIVPDLAQCRVNLRSTSLKKMENAEKELKTCLKNIQEKREVIFSLQRDSNRPPKPFTPAVEKLYDEISLCGKQLGMTLERGSSGGACDGNLLSEAGVPNLDTLGVKGGKLHTSEEYLEVDSLVQRAQLTALFLLKLANKEIDYSGLSRKLACNSF